MQILLTMHPSAMVLGLSATRGPLAIHACQSGKSNSALSPEHICVLNEIGMIWEKYADYKSEGKTCSVQPRITEI